jgi:hypothetical protein
MSLSLRSLVPAAGEAAAAGDQALADGGQLADSSNGVPNPTFTIDSEISPLLPKSLHGNENSDSGTITILRGGGKGGDSIAVPAASRGS